MKLILFLAIISFECMAGFHGGGGFHSSSSFHSTPRFTGTFRPAIRTFSRVPMAHTTYTKVMPSRSMSITRISPGSYHPSITHIYVEPRPFYQNTWFWMWWMSINNNRKVDCSLPLNKSIDECRGWK